MLLALALYFIQEGVAQQSKPDIQFFVEFPTKLLPLAYAVPILLIPTVAISAITIRRKLEPRRWPWVTTLLAASALGIIVAELGLDGVATIIDPTR